MSEQRKAVIKNADMSEEMQQDAVDIASQALAKYNIEKASRISAHGRIPTLPSFGRWGGGAEHWISTRAYYDNISVTSKLEVIENEL